MPARGAAVSAIRADRVMLGSDWPVCELAGTAERVDGNSGTGSARRP